MPTNPHYSFDLAAFLRDNPSLQSQLPGLTATANGMFIQPMYDNTATQSETGGPSSLTGYNVYPEYGNKNLPQAGDLYDSYSPDGTFDRTGEFRDSKGMSIAQGIAAVIASALGMGAIGGMTAGAAGAGAGGAAGGGAAAGGLGTLEALPLMSMEGLTPLAEYGIGAGGMGGLGAAGGGAAAAGGGGGLGTLEALPLMDAGTLPGASQAFTSSLPGAGASSLLSSARGLLGPAATALGALSGAQGQERENTEQRRTDPRLDPYYFGGGGQQGLLPRAAGLLERNIMPGYDQMMQRGMGLLATPQVGNGFSRFFPGR